MIDSILNGSDSAYVMLDRASAFSFIARVSSVWNGGASPDVCMVSAI